MKEEFKILSELKKQNSSAGFKVPDNYFESFDDKMVGVIKAEETPLVKKIVLVIKPWATLAAIFTLVALIYYTTPYYITENKSIVQASYNNDISLDFLSSRLDESDLIDFILEDGNSAIFENLQTNPDVLEGISIEDVEHLVIF